MMNININQQLTFVALYMVVALQGRNLLKMLNLSKMVPANSVQDALVHGLVFVILLYLVGMLRRRFALLEGFGLSSSGTTTERNKFRKHKAMKKMGHK